MPLAVVVGGAGVQDSTQISIKLLGEFSASNDLRWRVEESGGHYLLFVVM